MAFRNVLHDISESTEATLKTSILKFRDFCQLQNLDITDLDSFAFTDETLGKFMHYLSERQKSWGTARAYFSRFTTHLRRHNIYDVDENLITEANKKGSALFKEKADEAGVPLCNGAPPMGMVELKYICNKLLMGNRFQERAIIALDWQSLGRISEVAKLFQSQITVLRVTDRSPIIHCLKVDWYRKKTGKDHVLHIVPAVDYRICALHALGCYIILNTMACNELFPQEIIPNKKKTTIVGKVNSLLRSIESDYSDAVDFPPMYTRELTSHSIRKGAITYVGYYSWLNPIWTSLRGGFKPK